tara:strand:- start:571 stop:1191 length:621 start_codon:yes stop_codon:yes gene_type:complete
MSQLKLTADGGGGTVSLKGPSTTTGNAAIELTVPGTGSSTLATTATAGKILQVVSASKGDIQSWSGTTKTEITGLAPTITPSSASNKILVLGTLYSSSDTAQVTAYNVVERSINSGSFTIIGNHATASDSNSTQAHGHGGNFSGTWNLMNSSINFLDSPNTTQAIVYKWFFQSEISGTTYINRTGRNNTVYHPKTISVLTLMEVAA